jgi:tetratricopeptide (TPR) repeat protein
LQDISKQLGVKYVLEGGVRKAADQVRITVRLADATTGKELWAERYDRPLRDVFALQDEIVHRIVTTLNLQLSLSQQGFLIPRTTDNFEAYDDVLRGLHDLNTFTTDGNAKARLMFEKAVALDPNYAVAYTLLGWNYFWGEVNLLSPNPKGFELALQMGQQAIARDDSGAGAHSLLAVIYADQGQLDQAATEAKRSIALDPNNAEGYAPLALVMNNMGKPAEALAAIEKAIRLNPLEGVSGHLGVLATAYTQLGRYEEAIPVLKRDLAVSDFLWDHVLLVWDYSEMGQEDSARAELVEVERRSALHPNSPTGYLVLALALRLMGEPAQGLVAVQKAMYLDPQHSDNYLGEEGVDYLFLGRYADALAAIKRHVALHPGISWDHLGLAAAYIELGRDDEARAEAAEVLRLNPQFSMKMVFRTVGPKGKVLANNIRGTADLRKAGLQ